MGYRDYRRFGHSRFTAFTLSVHPAIFYSTVIAAVVFVCWAYDLWAAQ